MRILPYRTEDNRVDGVVLTFINIEQLHQMTTKLKYRSHLFKAVFKHSPAQIAILDAQLIIKEINYVEDEYTKEELVGQNIFSIVTKDQQKSLKNIIRKIKKKEIRIGSYDMQSTLVNGEKKWYQIFVIPVFDLEETNYIYIARDVSIFKQNELQIEDLKANQEQEIRRRMQQIISQNQQFSNTNNFLETFLEGAFIHFNKHFKKENIASLPTISLLLAKAKEVMDYQKDADKLIREVDAKAVFMEVKKALNKDLKAAKADIRYTFGKYRSFRYVKIHFYEILHVLLTNAIEYRNPDQALEIQLKTEQKDNFFILRIVDNGMGMDLKKQGHLLFKPFNRLNTTGEGLGLSLSMIDNLVRKTGGRIEVDSELGKGSIFKVYIAV